ncbi:helix-turn-helix domain-containing protein [Shouchella shacheensis]|uniref:helix-turn-helix domain-containing protein n=1 Tax=Shouchella shacheensis TaxID=1649580 RepID=UPI00074052A6|nr:helix-turn-helix domain-containing protein [Shouchella shacheensis]
MQFFLDKASYRKVKLLKLLDSQSDWWTSSQLANELGCSERALHTSLHTLASELKREFEQAGIEVNQRRGVRLNKAPNVFLHSYALHQLKKSPMFQLCHQMFQEDVTSLENFSESAFMSKSSLSRGIRKLKPLLDSYRLRLETRQAVLVGEEHQIRYFYFKFYWNAFKGEEWPFTFVEREELLDVVVLFEKALNTTFSCSQSEQILYHLAIARSRAGLNPEGRTPFVDVPYAYDHPLIEKAKEAIEGALTTFPSPERWYEQSFLESLLIAHPFFEKETPMLRQVLFHHWDSHSLPWQRSVQIFPVLSLSFKRNPPVESALLLGNLLQFHCHLDLFQGQNFMILDDSLLDSTAEEGSTVLKTLSTICEEMFPLETHGPLYKRKDEIILTYMALIDTYVDVSQLEPLIHIRIISSGGTVLENQIAKKLEEERAFNIRNVKSRTQEEPVDLIVTDRMDESRRFPAPVFFWSSCPTSNEWERLKKELAKIGEEKQGGG